MPDIVPLKFAHDIDLLSPLNPLYVLGGCSQANPNTPPQRKSDRLHLGIFMQISLRFKKFLKEAKICIAVLEMSTQHKKTHREMKLQKRRSHISFSAKCTDFL